MRHTHIKESKRLILKKLTKGSIFNSIGGSPCYQSERKVYICKILRKRGEEKRGEQEQYQSPPQIKLLKQPNISQHSLLEICVGLNQDKRLARNVFKSTKKNSNRRFSIFFAMETICHFLFKSAAQSHGGCMSQAHPTPSQPESYQQAEFDTDLFIFGI